jgi:hypothetical protein
MRRAAIRGVAAALLLFLAGCGAGSTVFVHPEYNFSYLERVAVVPFENLSSDQGAAARATRLFISDLLAAKAFDVVEPGEVSQALMKYGTIRTAELTEDQIREVGKTLSVQALVFGSLGESAGSRGGSSSTAGGRGFWAGLFGTSGPSEGEVMRQCVEKSVHSMLK